MFCPLIPPNSPICPNVRANQRHRQRKELSHTNLVGEVITQLAGRFRPEVTMVKARIEDLLSREYLERDEGGSSYRYLA